jgi:hypothetical protein
VSLTLCKWAWANMAGIPEWATPAEIPQKLIAGATIVTTDM